MKSRRAQSTDDYETWVERGVSPTLNAFDNGNDTQATVLIFTAQRVGEHPRIYENVTPSLLSRMGTGGNNVPMIATPEEPIAFDSNASGSFKVHADGKSPPVKIGSALGIPSPPAVATSAVVRRLTPLECERLMGWPDNHTLHRADGKTNSDSARYKMCGNGVATPVARWIAEQLLPLLNDD